MSPRLVADVRAELAIRFGQVWDADELHRDFQVTGWSAGRAHVRERDTEFDATLDFLEVPRFYYNLRKDPP